MKSKPQFDAGKRFEIRRRLGEGGMGVVFEAYDRDHEELVALKTMHRMGGHALARFKREFHALHDLSHPNLVELGELFDGESGPFFTMELVRGVNFLSHVRGLAEDADRGVASPTRASTRRRWSLPDDDDPADYAIGAPEAAYPPEVAVTAIPYDESRLRAALGQLALGIAALHDAGMVHRDIKPSNVLVTPDRRVVLLDFGLVAETASAKVTPDSSHACAVGTAAYMAPEQAISGDIGPAADWYSLGVLLFEALTGALPHSGRTAFDIILKKQQAMAAPARQFVPTVPADLDALCSGLLQTEVADRLLGRDVLARVGIEKSHGDGLDGRATSPSLAARTPFVGRSKELDELRAAFQRSREAPVIYLIEGVSGVGKTQLVEEFLEQLDELAPDAVVLCGRCYEREVVSYKAFDGIAEALARYLAHLPPVEVAGLMPLQAALLSRLFPVLRRVEAIASAPREIDVPDPHAQRRRMFAALRELFLRLTERRPLVCFIDDLQWTDADSLILLQDLLAGDEPLPLLLIATLRPIDDAGRRKLVATVEATAATERIQLGELTRDEARTLAGLLLPSREPAALDAVATETGGHPLFLHELARHLAASRDASASGATLEQMLAERIAKLPAPAQMLLQLVSLFGGPATQEVVAIAADLSHGEQVKAARVLRTAHLVRTDGVQRADRIVTYHDRVREQVARQLNPARRHYLHERLALALEQTGAAENDPRSLVRHARASGRDALAATHARAAARHAVSALAFDQAAEFLRTALELGSYDEAAQRSLRIELATALMQAGRAPEAAETFMRAADGADPAVRLACRGQAADQWLITGHLEKGLDVLRGSLAEIGEPFAATPRRALARVVWNRARLRLRGMRFRTRLESQVPAETLRRIDVLRAAAHGLAMIDNIRGADFNGRFLLLALRTGEATRLVGALGSEVVFLASQGGRAARRGRRLFDSLRQLAAECPNRPYGRCWVLLADGAASFFEGRFRPAVEALDAAETVFVEGPQGMTYERNNVRVFRLHTLRLLGALRRQASLIASLVRSGRQRGDRYLETTLTLLHGHSQLARDDVAGARDSIAGATWLPPEEGYHLQHWYELRARAELAMYEGRAAAACAELAVPFAELGRSMLLRVKLVRADAIALRGRLLICAAASGRGRADARAEVLRIARQLDSERAGYATVQGLLLRAGLGALDSKPSAEETVALLRRAIARAEEQSMALHLASARDRLGTLLGGDDGAALKAAAASYAKAEGICDPERMFATVAPGHVA